MNTPEKRKITVWVTFTSARLLEKMAENHRKQESAYVRDLVKEGVKKRDARIRAAVMRPEWWPPIERVVAEAVGQRLAEADLAGPWPALTEAEAARVALSGAWPGPHTPGRHLVQRSYQFPASLWLHLRTASFRVSEEPLRLLEERGLVGPGTLLLDDAQQAERARLAALLHSPGRIVRQALERYGPVPAEPAAAGPN